MADEKKNSTNISLILALLASDIQCSKQISTRLVSIHVPIDTLEMFLDDRFRA